MIALQVHLFTLIQQGLSFKFKKRGTFTRNVIKLRH